MISALSIPFRYSKWICHEGSLWNDSCDINTDWLTNCKPRLYHVVLYWLHQYRGMGCTVSGWFSAQSDHVSKIPQTWMQNGRHGPKKRSNITSSSLANLEGEEPVTAAKTAALKCRADAKLWCKVGYFTKQAMVVVVWLWGSKHPQNERMCLSMEWTLNPPSGWSISKWQKIKTKLGKSACQRHWLL